MKKLSLLLTVFICFGTLTYGQVEIKGTGNTSATKTWFTTNTTPDTTVVVLDNGDVGIGTTSPTEKLEVSGTIKTSSGVTYPDGVTQTIAYMGGVKYQNVITVAQSGADHTTISAALASIAVPTTPGNAFLIRVMPGIYNENVVCKPYVHIRGAGKYSTTITGSVTAKDNCIIEGFNIKGGITCNNASPTLIHNIISNDGQNGNGIEISNKGKPWITQNEIADCQGLGIYCHDIETDPWIIENKILRNNAGGIKIDQCSPTISNNYIFDNKNYGIDLSGLESTSANPTIDDNVIASSNFQTGGIGINMTGHAEPKIIANDIYQCEFGIWIAGSAQPSIISNDISYNFEAGIVCNSMGTYDPQQGTGKQPVIKGNHIHSNVATSATSHKAGIYIDTNGKPIVTHNNIHNNPAPPPTGGNDIDYFNSGLTPMISLNVFNVIVKNSTTATGLYNVTTAGAAIAP